MPVKDKGLQGKHVLLAVCGSIAAYKIAFLVRALVREKAHVRVVMSRSAQDFVSPLTLGVLSGNPVISKFTGKDKSRWNNHVELGAWADVMLIAPATANTLAKMANGICDSLLLSVYLSARCPVLFAPAMDLDMYAHPATRKNIKKLESFGNILIPAEAGELASGMVGEGRMAEPETLLEALSSCLAGGGKKKSKIAPLTGKRVLVTAGPTHEAIDPIRFIGNHSSGKMGFEIASALYHAGASVTVISGPTPLKPADPAIELVSVVSADEMLKACAARFPDMDMLIMSAAVADFTPAVYSGNKIKKTGNSMTVELKATRDILTEMAGIRKKGQILVGFALETDNEMEHAKKKLKEKNLDMIVLNSLNDEGAGFGGDGNKITIITRDNNVTEYELKPKSAVATDIVNAVCELF